MKKKRSIIVLSAALAAALVIVGVIIYDAVWAVEEVSRSDVAMGTSVHLNLSGKRVNRVCDRVIEAVKELDTKLISRTAKGSDVFNINQAAPNETKVNEKTAELINRALEMNEKTSGALNIGMGTLSKLWGFYTETPAVPTEKKIKEALALCGADAITVNGSTVRVAENVVIDLGAVGKGAACDEAKRILEANNINRAVVSVGGSVLLFGDGSFNLGVRNPRGEANDLLGTLKTTAGFASTSGDYEKFFEQHYVRYNHIIDPRTGYPAWAGLISVTVLCDNGFLSDALSTACFVLGYKQSLALLESYNAEAIFVTVEKEVFVTDGIKDSFQLSANDFKMGK